MFNENKIKEYLEKNIEITYESMSVDNGGDPEINDGWILISSSLPLLSLNNIDRFYFMGPELSEENKEMAKECLVESLISKLKQIIEGAENV